MKISGVKGLIKNKVVFRLTDKGGRRSGIEQRQFCYISHIPERRIDRDRRSGRDRRKTTDFKTSAERRSGIERRSAAVRFRAAHKSLD
jgi:hypothetical protein